ncbi:uncharacterized protein LOC107883478 isoform X2 [Acyrthosiphon pisum]|uniref:Uncharacterized protein n=1 Tax=Acyrthosiphon pisum TaxID=7029 RepID=A0A8R2D325_ACYPI|nr:uncharacterized protein LOC107883478 isoform X2 [Acyrthosiphon pisum]|eukprot:XP_016659069.1 PREDICTED: uncharacterized protein LOC107883478 isoform X2 [Acyrthosiphon pisum]
MNSNEMRQKFYNALSDLLKNKREDNKSFLNKEEYMLRLQEVKLAKEKIGKKSAKDYRYIRIGRSPYEAMFGCPVRLGVASVGFPLDETTNLNQEEDIEEIDNDINIRQEDDIENNLDGVQLTNNEHLINIRQDEILNDRQLSAKCLENQAKKMIKKSNKKFEDLEVGVNVRVSIPDVDRARGSPRNVLAVIISRTENGILKHLYTRTDIFPCKEKCILLENVLKLSAEK